MTTLFLLTELVVCHKSRVSTELLDQKKKKTRQNTYKVRFSKVFTFIKNLINIYNLIYFLFYYTLSNNFPPMKFNQFKYSQLMFLKSIKKYLNNIENISLWNKKNLKKFTFGNRESMCFVRFLEFFYIFPK